MTALILVVFLGAAVIAMPIAHALLVAAMAAAATSDRMPLDLLVQQMVAQVQSFPLIAIPFFMLTGTLMMGGKLGEALIGVLSALIGRFHGGPGQVGVLSSTHLRRRLGLRRGRRVGDRLVADPVAEAPRLPAGVLGRHAGRGGDDRHPDPAVDPADPVRAGEQRLDRGAVRRRHPAGPADVRRLHGRVLVGRPAPQLPARDDAARLAGVPQAAAVRVARADAAGADRDLPALRHGHADRSGGAVHAVRGPGVGADLPRPRAQAPARRGRRGRAGHRRGAAGDHGVGGDRLAAHVRPHARRRRRLGAGEPVQRRGP